MHTVSFRCRTFILYSEPEGFEETRDNDRQDDHCHEVERHEEYSTVQTDGEGVSVHEYEPVVDDRQLE